MLINEYCKLNNAADKREFISDKVINSFNIPYNIKNTQYVNIYSMLSAGNDISITISAHYDVVFNNYENCLDNSASVINLIKLYQKLKFKELKYNVSLAFIDAEETCDIYKCGINYIPFTDYLIDLELTASGNRLIMSKYNNFDLFKIPVYNMPYNCASALDMLQRYNNNITKSACVTMVSDNDIKQLDGYGYCDRWVKCHSADDTIANWYNEDDCDKLVDFLVHILT